MSLEIENIKDLMDGLDIAALFPDLEAVLAFVARFARLAVMAGPLLLLGLGLYFFLAAPREATWQAGYRFRWGMGSPEAWQFTQRLAGIVWGLLGLGLTIAMGVITTGFGALDSMDLLWRSVTALLWELALVVVSCLAINITVFSRYDRKGNRRLTWKELFRA